MIKRIYKFLSAMKTGLIIIVIVGIISAVGSAVSPDDFFHSPIFKISLVLLLLNMTLCTFNQLSRFVKDRNSPVKREQKNLIRRLGILALHIGIVMILTGGSINAFLGQDLPVKIIQGESLALSDAVNIKTPIQLHLDKFDIAFNEDGSVSQYYSYIRVIEEGKSDWTYDISVNHPFSYAGVKAYQHSYGYYVDTLGESKTGWNLHERFADGQHFEVEGTDKIIKVLKYIPNFDTQYGMTTKTLRPDNPAVVYSIYQNGQFAGMDAVALGDKIQVDEDKTVTFTGVTPYTVLTLKIDPGLWTAAAGGLLLMLGTCMSLLSKSQKQGD